MCEPIKPLRGSNQSPSMISKRDMNRLFITACIVGAGKANQPYQDEYTWGKLPEVSRKKFKLVISGENTGITFLFDLIVCA